jgi:hypothetical protein
LSVFFDKINELREGDMAMKRMIIFTAIAVAALAGGTIISSAVLAEPARAAADSLEDKFQNPPSEVYPGGGLFISTNPEAVRAQLEKHKKLGTHYLGVGSSGAPGAYMSDAWKQAIASTIAISHSMGFEASFLTSPGFSHTGDSRVKPEEAMKKLVWTVTPVRGGQAFSGRLASPPSNSGPFQNIPYFSESPWTIAMDKEFYRDMAVMAYRIPDPQKTAAVPVVTSSAGPIEAGRLSENDPRNPILLDGKNGSPWLQLDYPSPQTVRTAVLATPETRFEESIVADLSAKKEDGRYQKVATFNMRSSAQATLSFPAVRSTSFRLVFSRLHASVEALVPQGGEDIAPGSGTTQPFSLKRPKEVFAVSSLSLLEDGRVNEFERKAGFFTFVNDYYVLATDPEAVNSVTPKADVIDLTGRMQPDGILNWTPPGGNWEVLRFGYSLTGKINHPASPDATGLEVDKLSRTHMSNYLNRYLDGLLPAGEARKGVTGLFSDSIESSPQNWTDDMFAEFRKRRGYDMRPFMPALTGVVVESPAVTDKFLWDYRQTIADLMHENTYGVMSEIAHKFGLNTRVQALEQARHQLGDDFEMRRYADMPMGALWGSAPVVDYLKEFPNQVADQRGASSVAHLYGRKVVGAESGTTMSFPGAFSPRILKQLVDLEFAIGINWLSRGAPSQQDLWANYADDWLLYLARSSYMLQQGRYIADVAYFYGQDAPLVTLRERLSDAPLEYGFDYINTEALLNLVSVKNDRLTAPYGMEYRVLQLGGSSNMMTVGVLRRLRDLVKAGLVVAGPAPTDTPSLTDQPAEFQDLRMQLWGADGRGRKLGKGQVYGTGTIAEVLAALGVAPDLTARPGRVGDDILFQHRTLSDGDFYFVMNRSERAGGVELSFRQTGKEPELWRADTGERTQLSYRIENERTIVPVDFRANDAMFVVFRRPAQSAGFNAPKMNSESIAIFDGDWLVSFLADRGGPDKPVQMKAGSWTDSSDPGVKYYSGTATYSRTVDVPAGVLDGGAKVLLSLGEVQDIADVTVNGAAIGVRWTPPYSFDITRALRHGQNRIEVKVTNRAINRMIGDKQPGAKPVGRSGFGGGYKPDAPLRPSGLIGPVSLIRKRK